MYEVTVEAGFSSGHYLRNYRGKCENPHGHNYKVFVTLMRHRTRRSRPPARLQAPQAGHAPSAVDYLDHQMINDLKPFNEVNPSAENLARYFFEQDLWPAPRNDRTAASSVKDCTLYETDTSFARYYE